MSKALADYSQKDQNKMDHHKELLPLRREAYAAHVASMTIPPEIATWARKMEFRVVNSRDYEEWCQRKEIMPDNTERAKWCKTLGVFYNRLPLIEAFMVIRYGEEPVPHWPSAFPDDDIQRANMWFDYPRTVPGIIGAIKA